MSSVLKTSMTPATDLAQLRKEYTRGGLRENDLDPDPITQFQKWFQQAVSAGIDEPNAMTLSTSDSAGQPSSRIVLLKGLDPRGFSFFTNYESRKGRELAANPRAALTFHWMLLERQVNVAGTVSRLDRAESEVYFKSRPRGNRLGAWVSHQSVVVPSRAHLEKRWRETELLYPGEEIPLPPYWGGFVLAPSRVEFWQGQPNRLHDRLCYIRQDDTMWRLERLAP